MKYLITVFALTIFASSSVYACSEKDMSKCKSQADCDKLGNYSYQANGATKCLLRTSESDSNCSMVNTSKGGKTPAGATDRGAGSSTTVGK